jgi:hypothetical protein
VFAIANVKLVGVLVCEFECDQDHSADQSSVIGGKAGPIIGEEAEFVLRHIALRLAKELSRFNMPTIRALLDKGVVQMVRLSQLISKGKSKRWPRSYSDQNGPINPLRTAR